MLKVCKSFIFIFNFGLIQTSEIWDSNLNFHKDFFLIHGIIMVNARSSWRFELWSHRFLVTCLDGPKKWHTQIIMNEPWQMVFWVSKEETILGWWSTCFHYTQVAPRLKATMDGEQSLILFGAVTEPVCIYP